jgi:hypothetical protein
MKNILAFLSLAVLVVTSAQAAETLIVNLPYRVTAGQVELTPGEYEIRCVAPNAGAPALAIYDRSAGRYRALVVSQRLSTSPSTESSVILDRTGDSYTLREVRMGGGATSFWIPGKPALSDRDREAMSASVPVKATTVAN